MWIVAAKRGSDAVLGSARHHSWHRRSCRVLQTSCRVWRCTSHVWLRHHTAQGSRRITRSVNYCQSVCQSVRVGARTVAKRVICVGIILYYFVVFFTLRLQAFKVWIFDDITRDRPRQRACKIKLMLSRVSWAFVVNVAVLLWLLGSRYAG